MVPQGPEMVHFCHFFFTRLSTRTKNQFTAYLQLHSPLPSCRNRPISKPYGRFTPPPSNEGLKRFRRICICIRIGYDFIQQTANIHLFGHSIQTGFNHALGLELFHSKIYQMPHYHGKLRQYLISFKRQKIYQNPNILSFMKGYQQMYFDPNSEYYHNLAASQKM